MKARYLVLAAVLVGCAGQRPEAGTVELTAVDGLPVFGDWHPAETAEPAGTLVVFHQGGGDVRGEYQRIVPRLNRLGFDVFGADLRRGGDRFGSVNRTAPPGADSLYTYCDALPDVEAALNEALRFDPQPILWGSSFSAALVIQAAARQPDHVKGVLAFSPASGDPMEGCRPEAVSGGLDVPLLVVRAQREMEYPSVSEQMAHFEEEGHITFVADPGVHGSSSLDAELVGASTEEAWRVVEAFLRGLPR